MVNTIILLFSLVKLLIVQGSFSKLKSLWGNVSQIGKVKRVHGGWGLTPDEKITLRKTGRPNINKMDSCYVISLNEVK